MGSPVAAQVRDHKAFPHQFLQGHLCRFVPTFNSSHRDPPSQNAFEGVTRFRMANQVAQDVSFVLSFAVLCLLLTWVHDAAL